MEAIAARAVKNAPSRLVARTSRHCSSDILMASPSRVTPALTTATSTGPNSCDRRLDGVVDRDECDTSTAKDFAHPAGASAEREKATTVSPFSTKYWAIAAPMPRLAPVTMTWRLIGRISCNS